ncbi:hypothetical protein RP20_CCG018986 [Aedes albopictus]|nr:hypothetical protein RP20_CCG018986 [Aedes albopictus]
MSDNGHWHHQQVNLEDPPFTTKTKEHERIPSGEIGWRDDHRHRRLAAYQNLLQFPPRSGFDPYDDGSVAYYLGDSAQPAGGGGGRSTPHGTGGAARVAILV